MQELLMVVERKREEAYEERKFFASMNGIDLDKHRTESVDSRLEEINRRAQARLMGGEQALERAELTDLGFTVETE